MRLELDDFRLPLGAAIAGQTLRYRQRVRSI
jgi:hypothetical protein